MSKINEKLYLIYIYIYKVSFYLDILFQNIGKA